ncbi:MAG: hypothetical protein HYY81_13140 [Deltaproteobacteria bacterium]|nr:hypothetical protein [Deltaproteobacteria bacterium]
MKRLRRKMRQKGVRGLLHGHRGRKPWNRATAELLEKVLRLAQQRYKGLNDTHLTEKLNEGEGIALSRPTVRRILRQAGIIAVRTRRPKRHYKRR